MTLLLSKLEHIGESPFEPFAESSTSLIHVSHRYDVYPPHTVHISESDLASDDEDKNEETTEREVGVLKRRLAGRTLGDDFSKLNRFSMYCGRTVPGFPRLIAADKVETFMIVRKGFVDYTDSTGAEARLGPGDAMSLGSSFEWSEMYPLVNAAEDNPVETIHVCLACPLNPKSVSHVIWSENQPMLSISEDSFAKLIAGSFYFNLTSKEKTVQERLEGKSPCDNRASLALFSLTSDVKATIPAAWPETSRYVCFLSGDKPLELTGEDGKSIVLYKTNTLVQVRSDCDLVLQSESSPAVVLLLQMSSSDHSEVEATRKAFIECSDKARQLFHPSKGAQEGDEWTYQQQPVRERVCEHSIGRFYRASKDEPLQRPNEQSKDEDCQADSKSESNPKLKDITTHVCGLHLHGTEAETKSI